MSAADDPETEEALALTSEEEAIERAALRRSVRDQIRDSGPVLLIGLIPLGLVIMFLGLLLGNWVWKALPVFVVMWFYGLPLLINYRAHADSSLPLDLPRLGRLTGKSKRRTVALASVALLVVIIAVKLGGLAVVELRAWLLAWRV